MLQRGDIVEYHWHGGDSSAMNGQLAVVLGPHRDNISVRVRLLEIGRTNPWTDNPSWTETPFFDVENCVKIGHIDLDAV